MKVKFEIDGIIYDGKRYSKGDVVEVCKTMAEKYMHRKLATEYVEEEYAIIVSKEKEELLKKINSIISKLKSDGTIDAIQKKYIK